MKNMKNKMTRTVLVCSAAGMLLLGGTAAYLTDHDEAVNEFTVGKVDIEIDEPEWKPEENKKIVPTQEIKKDPMITNTGINDAFVYLQVSVPKASVITADKDGKRLPKANQELFTYKKNAGWTLIETKDLENEKSYTYSYDKILKPGEATGTLFDTVTFANVIEGELDTQQISIPVHAYAIQTANTAGNAEGVPAQAKEAYTKYVNQNTVATAPADASTDSLSAHTESEAAEKTE